jgi:RING-type zinc-finger
MAKKNQAAVDANLLNFHFSNGPQPSQQSPRPRSSSFNNTNSRGQRNNGRGSGGGSRGGNNKKKEYQRTAEDRASARRKAASNMFPLHSSPDHAFVISRQKVNHTGNGGSCINGGSYSFEGPDVAVSWESVRVVKYLVAMDQLDTSTVCPICLDTFTVARITKCGHCFCFPCLIHHVHSYADKTYAPKCPCCAIPLHLQDVRPVQLVTVTHSTPPAAKSNVRFVKLHRVKECPTPYLPHPSSPRRSSRHAAPCVVDNDAAYCKFNYVDIPSYQNLLQGQLQELLQQKSSSTLEAMCLGTAVQMVQDDLTRCLQEASAEQELQLQFQSPTSGMYQAQCERLLFTCPPDHAASPLPSPALLTQIYACSSSWDDIQSPTASIDNLVSNDHVANTDEAPSSPFRRGRGDSISSYGGMSACSDSTPAKHATSTCGGTMYANDDEYVFYQIEDGSLCFLSGFNMLCLQAEYSTTRQHTDQGIIASKQAECVSPRSPTQSHDRRPPLPDVIEGKVLEVERIHMTAEIRQRRRFLSHIPLHVDVCLVEISVEHVLSHKTKQQFKKEFQQRKQKRISKETAEKRSDERLKRQEEERINELKSRIQRIDPNDDFFLPVALPDPEPNLTGEEFGPTLTRLSNAEARAPTSGATKANPPEPRISFSQVCRAGDAFPALGSASTEENFPALGSSPPTTKRAPAPRPWGTTSKLSPGAPDSLNGEKKNKGKKIVLFSTGGARGDYV